MKTYTFSYNVDREEHYLSPHPKWWRRWLGQKVLSTIMVNHREHFTFDAVDKIAESEQWFHDVLIESTRSKITKVQLEDKHFPTSFIPTNNSIVSREADSYEALGHGELELKSGSRKYVTEEDGSVSLLLEPSSTNYIRNSM